METLLGVRHLTKKGDYTLSFDLQDGFYALGIAEADRDYFTVDVRGQLYMLAGLPMGWSLSPYYFVTRTQVFITHLRKPEPEQRTERTESGQTAGAGTYQGHGPKYPSAHADIAALLHYFDAARQVFAGGRVLAARWAISQREGQAKWTADTLAATAAYVIGVTMQKIKYFGGWAMESSVVLDYIDPTVLRCPPASHLFGWVTPWGDQPARLPRQMAT
eukprot:jgi/Tetstr1/462383/TSEL_007389.t1